MASITRKSMKAMIYASALPLALASCSPQAEQADTVAIAACQRTDVQDVVGKEVRHMILKAVSDRGYMVSLLGIDGAMAKAFEEARVTFTDVGVFTGDGAEGPYKQIVCSGSIQIDTSSTRWGQDIITMPHLRWSVNFAQPTEEPATAAFSVAVDPESLKDGLLVNGKPPANDGTGETKADTDSAPAAAAGEAEAAALDAAASAEKAKAEAAAAEVAAMPADANGDTPSQSRRQPTEDDLYAPHNN